jgi:hypothetical protein
MGYFHTDETTRGQPRLVFGDRVVSRLLCPDAATGGELRPRRYRRPAAMNVTLAELPERSSPSPVVPVWVTYEDDPAAEFEDPASGSAFFHDPGRAPRLRT